MPTGRQVLHGVDQMGEVAAEAVELPDDEHVVVQRRAPAASPQQAGLRAAAVRPPLPGPTAGPGRVRSPGGRGLHRPPAPPGRGGARRHAVRAETRHEHLAELRRLYGFRSFSGGAARELVEGLHEEAPQAQSNEDLVRRFVEACRRTRTILPATTTIERLCADALVDAERRIEARIAERVPPGLRRDLEHLLEETVDAGVTRFVWLRQFEPGSNSADANRLLDRLEHLRRLAVPEGLFGDIPPHRITRLRRQGERYFADGLRELPDNRRLAILGVCAVEWETFVADAVVETHDRIVGRTYREAARTCESQLGDETAAVREALRAFAELGRALIGARDTGEALDGRGPRGAAAFAELGRALIGARDTGEALDAVIADRPGWGGLGDLVARAAALANTNSKWSRRLRAQVDPRLWETAVLFHLRDAFRAGDVWLARSRRYGDIRRTLLAIPAGPDADRSLPVPARPRDWLAERQLAAAVGLLPGDMVTRMLRHAAAAGERAADRPCVEPAGVEAVGPRGGGSAPRSAAGDEPTAASTGRPGPSRRTPASAVRRSAPWWSTSRAVRARPSRSSASPSACGSRPAPSAARWSSCSRRPPGSPSATSASAAACARSPEEACSSGACASAAGWARWRTACT